MIAIEDNIKRLDHRQAIADFRGHIGGIMMKQVSESQSISQSKGENLDETDLQSPSNSHSSDKSKLDLSFSDFADIDILTSSDSDKFEKDVLVPLQMTQSKSTPTMSREKSEKRK